ncbi:MAG: NAD(P)H-dependent oxidoreductase [Chitinophagales bacterium]|nr:NAD(P)H-dependent oxidoreductase [Chitinophagales bacterium]
MNIAIISASIREHASTRRVAAHLLQQMKSNSHLHPEVIDLAVYDYPIWKEVFDKEINPPAMCVELHHKLLDADALIFVTPEYNGSYSLALKNMIDYFSIKAFEKKAIGVTAVSTGALGGIRAGLHLQQLILAIYAIPVPQMLLVPQINHRFDENGNLLDASFEKNVMAFLRDFIWLAQAIHTRKNIELKSEPDYKHA